LMHRRRKYKIKNKAMSFGGADQTAIIINKVKVTSNFINTTHDLIQGSKLLRYWNQQDRFPAGENANIDWDVVKHARISLPFDRQTWMVKQVSGFCGTGEKMKLWQYCKDDVCPLCNDKENGVHILKCHTKQANQQWMISIETLKVHLLNSDTPSNTVDIIVHYLQAWPGNDHTTVMNITNKSSSLTAARLAQEYIG